MRADDVALRADAEELGLDGVQVVLAGRSSSAKMASSDSARRSRGPLRSAGVSFMPSGIQTLVTQGVPRALPMAAPIFAAGDAVLDPEPADGRVGLGEREAVGRLGMGEVGRVEVQADAAAPWPSRSSLWNWSGLERVALDLLAAVSA